MVVRTFEINREDWPPGVSDGLVFPCYFCGQRPVQFDYVVDDRLWEAVVPQEAKRDVVCLPCLDRLAKANGFRVADYLEEVQFTGVGETIQLIPAYACVYEAGGE